MPADDPETLVFRLPAALAAAQASHLSAERWSPPLRVLSSVDHTADPSHTFARERGSTCLSMIRTPLPSARLLRPQRRGHPDRRP